MVWKVSSEGSIRIRLGRSANGMRIGSIIHVASPIDNDSTPAGRKRSQVTLPPYDSYEEKVPRLPLGPLGSWILSSCLAVRNTMSLILIRVYKGLTSYY